MWLYLANTKFVTRNIMGTAPCLSLHTALLQSFLRVDRIKQHFKGKLVGMVLDGYLSLRRYICIHEDFLSR